MALEIIPSEILDVILFHLNYKSLYNLLCVSKYLFSRVAPLLYSNIIDIFGDESFKGSLLPYEQPEYYGLSVDDAIELIISTSGFWDLVEAEDFLPNPTWIFHDPRKSHSSPTKKFTKRKP